MPTPVSECLYCQNNETLHKLMIKICDLEVSQVFLFKEQTYSGRCNVVYKYHGVDFHQLEAAQRDAFMRDVATVAKAIENVFSPDKVNYGSYADSISHLHFHVVPKYKDGFGFGGVFEMNPQKTYLSDETYALIVSDLKSELKKSE